MSSPLTIYETMGAEFILHQYKMTERLQSIKAFVFDWDGVFNNGEKHGGGSSSFSEIDSMGTNLLRFSYFLQHKKLPATAILSGEKNESAFYFAKREHFDSSYFKIPNKIIGINHFCEANNIKPNEVCYFFDDVLDLPVAKVAGLRVFIPRKAGAQFTAFVKQNHLADYITASASADFAVREACEMLMTVSGQFDKAITSRMNYDDVYKQYIEARNGMPTAFFTLSNQEISKVEL
jgi:3-deoxy-D-manno-octulosonate 8-phosphate phosphatase (KDO 8-P phosphatase)